MAGQTVEVGNFLPHFDGSVQSSAELWFPECGSGPAASALPWTLLKTPVSGHLPGPADSEALQVGPKESELQTGPLGYAGANSSFRPTGPEH